jgi:hypothetical protein
MKSVTQIAALLIVLVGGVFGVTFLTQYTRKPAATEAKVDDDTVKKDLLKCFETKAEWDKLLGIPGYQFLEMEQKSHHHYDFLIANMTEKPVSVILNSQFSCICARLKVYLGVLPEAARTDLAGQKVFVMPESDRLKLPGAKPTPIGPKIEPYLAGVDWKLLEYDPDRGPSPPVPLPAADAVGPRYAVLRMDWDTREIKANTLKADIVARQGSAADYRMFEVPINVTAPILSSTSGTSGDMLSVGELNPGDVRENSFFVWSPTRDQFEAKLELQTPDPCIVVSAPRKIVGEELKKLPAELAARANTTTVTNTKSAYEFKITVYESRDGQQLELGPLARRVWINRETDTEMTFGLNGVVRGPLTVGRPDDRDRVDLRLFRADHGAEKMVEIKAPTPGLVLSVDNVTPNSMQAELIPIKTASGTTSWKLTVTVPPNTQAGPMPTDSAIYLKMNTTPPRRVRIPVAGNASG